MASWFVQCAEMEEILEFRDRVEPDDAAEYRYMLDVSPPVSSLKTLPASSSVEVTPELISSSRFDSHRWTATAGRLGTGDCFSREGESSSLTLTLLRNTH